MTTNRRAMIVYHDYYSGREALQVREVNDAGRHATGMTESPVFDRGSLAKNKAAATEWAREHRFHRLNGRAY